MRGPTADSGLGSPPGLELAPLRSKAGKGHIPSSEDRIFGFESDRMLARVSALAGGVSSGAGAHSRSAIVGEFRVGSRTDVAYSPGTFSDRRVTVGLSGGVWSTDL